MPVPLGAGIKPLIKGQKLPGVHGQIKPLITGEHGIQIFAPCKYKAKVEQTVIDSITNAPKLDKDGQPMRETVEVEKRGFKVVTVFDISSTEIRSAVAAGEDVSQWLHPDVVKFIKDKNLYL